MRVDDIHQNMTAENRDQIAALKSGDSEVWREVFARNGPGLIAYARRMLSDHGLAEDVVQEALINVYRTIDMFDGRCSIKSWLYRAVRNKSIDEIRRLKRYVDVGDDPENGYFKESDGHWQDDCNEWDGRAARELEHKRLLRIVHDEINNLPHAYREVLLLKEVEGLEPGEICAALDISAGNLRIKIHRARSALRAAVRSKLNKE